jgi:phosphatidylserine/phosphatidylglycerophosphate/cardiolipin synthase-like enzyme
VRVRLLTNSVETNDLDYANHRLYTGFRALLDAGAELSVRRGEGRTLHCKYFVADGEWVSLGSSNLDYYSPRFCTEVNVQAHDPDLGARLTGWFEAGRDAAHRPRGDRRRAARERREPRGRPAAARHAMTRERGA